MALPNTGPFQFWPGKKVFCLITGANEEIGESFSLELVKLLRDNIVLALIGSSEDNLNNTKEKLSPYTRPEHIYTKSMDFSVLQSGQIYDFISKKLKKSLVHRNYFDNVLLICCAESVGNLEHSTTSMCDTQEWQRYMSLNVSSCAVQVYDFMKVFACCDVKRFVVNISSVFTGIGGVPSLGYYCVGKAARDMYFKVLAKENRNIIRVLNYSPGPVRTNMVNLIRRKVLRKNLPQEFLRKLKGCPLTPTMVTTRAIRLLQEDSYVSGKKTYYYKLGVL